MNTLAHIYYMTMRSNRALIRQPWWIAFSLIQPIVWLLLYGQLFKRVVELPGFNATSYITFITPGVIIMSALFAGGWNGMGSIVEIDRGIMDRFLVSPISRVAVIAGRLMNMALTITIQAAIILSLGFLMGARFDGGWSGIPVLVSSAILLAIAIGALSNALALLVRRQESVIGASNFILLPMTFLSPVFMAKNLMPDWMKSATRFNPVNWSVEAARSALSASTDWTLVSIRLAMLLVFALVSAWLATMAFRSYQRSI